MPQKLKRPLVAIFGKHAGAAELEEAQPPLPGDKRRDIELSVAVETAEPARGILAKQPVGADDFRLAAAPESLAGRMVDHDQVVARRVEAVLVAAHAAGAKVGDRRHLVVEHLIAERLRAAYFRRSRGQPHLKIAKASERSGFLGR